MKTILPIVCAFSFLAAGSVFSADEKPVRKGTPPPVQSAWQHGAKGNYLLSSGKFRERLGLSDRQERQLDKLAEGARKLWAGHAEKSASAREKIGEAAIKILTEIQREQLVGLETISASWFSVVGYGNSLAGLGVGEEEREKIGGIMEAHRKERTEAFGQVAKADPEALKRAKEFQAKHQRILEEAKTEAREILGKSNMDALLNSVARTRLQGLIHQERYVKELGLADEQLEKIGDLIKKRSEAAREIGEVKDAGERAERWREWSGDNNVEVFEILTDAQKRRLPKLDMVEAMWFSSLSWPATADELDLPEERRTRLDAVLKGYQEKRAEAYRPDPKAAARARETQEKYRKMVEETKAAVREVLTDGQFDALLRSIARNQLPYLFRRADVAKEIGLSEKQIDKLEALAKRQSESARKRAAKVAEKRRTLGEKAVDVLDASQKKKFDEMIRSPRPVIRVQGGQGGFVKPAVPEKGK